MKNKLIMIMCFFMSALLIFNSSAYASIYTFETQYEHSMADNAWLTDLVVKEDMLSVSGMAQRTEITALPDIPYTQTPESFKSEVEKYCSLYTLKEGSERAGYIYLFDLLGSGDNIFSFGATDQDVKDYLQGNGVQYPASIGSDELIMARALYIAMMTGTFSASSYYDENGALALEQALAAYASQLSGIKQSSLAEWMPTGSILSLDDYILAASKLALWTNGYEVSVDTDSTEVFRLVAVMTVEKLGISVNKEMSFEELKAIYTAALLGKKYGVVMDPVKLSDALANDSAAFYVLQLIGQQEAGLSIRQGSIDFTDAFFSVAENTSVFAVEPAEFYADVYKYEAYLSNRCSSIWLYPTAYSSDAVSITANGKSITNNFYTEVPLNASLDKQDIVIRVTCTSGASTSTCEYTLTVYQGSSSGSAADSSEADTENESPSFATSDSVVAGVFSSLGVNDSVSAILEDFYSAMPAPLKNAFAVIAPTFGDGTAADNVESTDADVSTTHSDDYFASVLDGIGSFVNADMKGIGAVDMAEKYVADVFSFDYITFE